MGKLIISDQTSRQLSVMSFICACMIVAIHCTPNPSLGSWQWWVVNLIGADGLCRIAVPWFFIASGFFIAGRVEENGWYSKAISKRVRTLLIPFVAWAIIGLAFNWCVWYGIQKVGYACGVKNPMDDGLFLGVIRVLGFDINRMNIGPIWYLRSVFLLAIVSPVICWGVRKFGLLFPSALFVMYGIYDTTIHFSDFWEYVFSVRGLAYFTIGIAIRMGAFDNLEKCLGRSAEGMLLLMGLGMLIINAWARLNGIVLLENFSDFAMVVPILVGTWNLVRYVALPRWCTRNAFALYVLHGIFLKISIVLIVVLKVRSMMDVSVLLACARWVFGICFAIATAQVVRLIWPRCASILFGGR